METNPNAPVETGLPPQEGEIETPVVEGQGSQNARTVSIASVLGEKPADGSTETKAPTEKKKPDAPGAATKPKQTERLFTQSEFNRLLGERLEEERKKPAYQYGQAAIASRAKRDGVTEAEAFNRIRTEENARIAKEYAENPEKAYNDMLNGTFNPYSQQQPTPQTTQKPQEQYRFTPENIAETLESMQTGGKLPNGFNEESVTDDFVLDAMKNGTEAALYRWMMSNQSNPATAKTVAEELERRRQLPRPMQTSGGNVTNQPVDIKKLSDEDFKKLDEEIAKGNRSGFAVRLQD